MGSGNSMGGGKTHFRFDNGFENPSDGGLASYMAVTNTDPIVIPPNAKFRLRWAMERDRFGISANFAFEFWYKQVGDVFWTEIRTDSSVVNLVASDFVNNHDHSTAYTGDPGDLDEKLYVATWNNLTNFSVLTDEPTGLTGVSGWPQTFAPRSQTLEASLRVDPTLEGGTKFQIQPRIVSQTLSNGYDIIPVIEVGRRVFNRS